MEWYLPTSAVINIGSPLYWKLLSEYSGTVTVEDIINLEIDMATSSSGNTTQLQGLSFLADLLALIHGKGGAHKIVPALDLVEQLAVSVATLYPPSASVVGGVVAVAEVGKAVFPADVPVDPNAPYPAAV